ncbi:unnamed protein product, partial [Ectocarpus sp. 13 AM-2016]
MSTSRLLSPSPPRAGMAAARELRSSRGGRYAVSDSVHFCFWGVRRVRATSNRTPRVVDFGAHAVQLHGRARHHVQHCARKP